MCDVGTVGGVWGLERGYCQMIGGETEVIAHLDPIFKTLAPGRPLSRPQKDEVTEEHRKVLHCGPWCGPFCKDGSQWH
jgi:6-phosphogluconate dehydrogenase